MAHIVGTSGNDRGATVLHGTVDDDLIEGLAGNDQLLGDDGDDVLDGGTGLDNMAGGNGNDTYYVDNVGDIVTELHGGGRDTVYSNVTYTLSADVEKLLLTGSANISGFGNAGNNTVVGNDGNNKILGGDGDDTLGGGAGNDTLDGGKGADGMKGGAGNDRYYIDNPGDLVTEYTNAGDDTVLINGTYTLTNNVENLIIAGSSNRFGTGNALDNHITGSAGDNTLGGADGNDVIDGGKGADLMRGGLGNDTFYVDNTGDVVAEYTNAGTDSVFSSVTFTLGNNVENLALTGTGNHNATGNSLDNMLTGNAGNNVMNGKAGADTMRGGAGNDTYYVDNAGDVVTELAGQGTDTVLSSVSYALAFNIENLTLTGSGDTSAGGNKLDNHLIGNSGNNSLSGGAGNDILDGGEGADIMMSGGGSSIFYVDNIGDQVISGSNDNSDQIYSSISYTLSGRVVNLTLTGTADIDATGDLYNNVLNGNSGNNTLRDGGGKDTMAGGAGNDSYFINITDNIADNLVELADGGIDSAVVSGGTFYRLPDNVENLHLLDAYAASGNAQDNIIVVDGSGPFTDGNIQGLDGNDTITGCAAGTSRIYGGNGDDVLMRGHVLNGGAGADTMIGGNEANEYFVDNIGDVVIENGTGGPDVVSSKVSFVMPTGIEQLWLDGSANIDGTGNDQDNLFRGNSGDNVLNGGGGHDTADYGASYNGNLTVNLATGVATGFGNSPFNGTDTLISIEVVIGANRSTNTLIGSDGSDTLIGGTDDSINDLDGGAGADVMKGRQGDNTYHVDNSGDVVVGYNSPTNVSLVISSIDYQLGDFLKDLTLTGTDNLSGAGNGLSNTLIGNAGDNVLTGGAGADTFIFLPTSGGDTIGDFSSDENDRIDVSAYTGGTVHVEYISQVGSDAVIDLGDGNIITVANTQSTDSGFLGHIIW